MKAALDADAEVIHKDYDSNLCWERNVNVGDVKSAFAEADVVIEEEISGIEVTCGVFFNTKTKKIHKLPITEIRTKEEFFNYKAKYEGKSQEITPAKIHPILAKKYMELRKKYMKIYRLKDYAE